MFNKCLEIGWKTAHFCIFNFSFLNPFVWEVISSIRYSVLSPDETLRLILDILYDRYSYGNNLPWWLPMKRRGWINRKCDNYTEWISCNGWNNLFLDQKTRNWARTEQSPQQSNFSTANKQIMIFCTQFSASHVIIFRQCPQKKLFEWP